MAGMTERPKACSLFWETCTNLQKIGKILENVGDGGHKGLEDLNKREKLNKQAIEVLKQKMQGNKPTVIAMNKKPAQ